MKWIRSAVSAALMALLCLGTISAHAQSPCLPGEDANACTKRLLDQVQILNKKRLSIACRLGGVVALSSEVDANRSLAIPQFKQMPFGSYVIIDDAKCLPGKAKFGVCLRFEHESDVDAMSRLTCRSGQLSGVPTPAQLTACGKRHFFVRSLHPAQRSSADLNVENSTYLEEFRQSDLRSIGFLPPPEGSANQQYASDEESDEIDENIDLQIPASRQLVEEPNCLKSEFGFCARYEHESRTEAYMRLKCMEGYLFGFEKIPESDFACKHRKFEMKGKSPLEEAGYLKDIYSYNGTSLTGLELARRPSIDAMLRDYFARERAQQQAEISAKEAQEQAVRDRAARLLREQDDARIRAEREREERLANDQSRERRELLARLDSVRVVCLDELPPQGCAQFFDESKEEADLRRKCYDAYKGTITGEDPCVAYDNKIFANIRVRIQRNEEANRNAPGLSAAIARYMSPSPEAVATNAEITRTEAQVQDLRDQRGQALQVIEELRARLATRESEIREASLQVESLRRKGQEMDQRIAALLANAEQERVASEQHLAAAAKARNLAAIEAEKARVEERRIENDMRKVASDRDALMAQNNRLQAEREQLLGDIHRVESEQVVDQSKLAALRDAAAKLDERIRQAQSNRDARIANERRATDEANRAREDAARRASEEDARAKDLAIAKARALDSARLAGEQRARSYQMRQQMDADLAVAEDALRKTLGDLASATKERDDWKSRLAKLQGERQASAADLQKFQDLIAAMDARIAAIQADQISQTQAKDARQQNAAEVERLGQAIAATERSVAEGKSTLEEANRETTRIRKELDRLSNERKTNAALLDTLNQKNEALQAKIDIARREALARLAQPSAALPAPASLSPPAVAEIPVRAQPILPALDASAVPASVGQEEASRKVGLGFPRLIDGKLCLRGKGTVCDADGWYTKYGPPVRPVAQAAPQVAPALAAAVTAPAPRAPLPSTRGDAAAAPVIAPPVPAPAPRAPLAAAPPAPQLPPTPASLPSVAAATQPSLAGLPPQGYNPNYIEAARIPGPNQSPVMLTPDKRDVLRLLNKFTSALQPFRRMTEAEMNELADAMIAEQNRGGWSVAHSLAKMYLESRLYAKDVSNSYSINGSRYTDNGLMQIQVSSDNQAQRNSILALAAKYNIALPYSTNVPLETQLTNPTFNFKYAAALNRDNVARFGKDGKMHPALADVCYNAGCGKLVNTVPRLRGVEDDATVWRILAQGDRMYNNGGGFTYINNVTGPTYQAYSYARNTRFATDWMNALLANPDSKATLNDFKKNDQAFLASFQMQPTPARVAGS